MKLFNLDEFCVVDALPLLTLAPDLLACAYLLTYLLPIVCSMMVLLAALVYPARTDYFWPAGSAVLLGSQV